jgi:hypothetical protein
MTFPEAVPIFTSVWWIGANASKELNFLEQKPSQFLLERPKIILRTDGPQHAYFKLTMKFSHYKLDSCNVMSGTVQILTFLNTIIASFF